MKHVDLWLTLDMERSVDQAVVRVPRLDNWRRIIVRLRVGDAPYELPPGAMASWSLDRMGKAVNLNEIAATVSTMQVGEETEQIVILQWQDEWTRVAGAFRAIIHMVGSDGEDLWSPTFQFIVTESPYDDATVRQSPQFTALVQARLGFLEKVAEMTAFMESAVTFKRLYEALNPGEDGTDATMEEAADTIVTVPELQEALDGLSQQISSQLDVKSAIKLAIRYLMGAALFETQEQAATYNALYTAALAYLDGNWLTGEGGYVPPSPGGWSIDASGDWVIINAAPIVVGTDYIILGGTPL